jgi:RecB family exonuclease
MDRVDIQNNESLEVIDYKTGATIPSQTEVDKNLQLTFYALAAFSIKEEPFNKNPEKVDLSLYFFDNQEKLTTRRTKKDLEKAIDDIYKIRNEIENSDFKCSKNILCEKCEFNLFCRED